MATVSRSIPGIFPQESSTYAVLDGACIPDLLKNLYEFRPEYECLLRGELKPDMAEVAPYLLRLTPDSEFTGWLLENAWGNHWGVFVNSSADFRSLHRHFRTFLVIHDPGGKPLYFRYYDPRVLRVYLPTCDAEQLKQMFGPVESYVLEDDSAQNALVFRLSDGALQQEVLKMEA